MIITVIGVIFRGVNLCCVLWHGGESMSFDRKLSHSVCCHGYRDNTNLQQHSNCMLACKKTLPACQITTELKHPEIQEHQMTGGCTCGQSKFATVHFNFVKVVFDF